MRGTQQELFVFTTQPVASLTAALVREHKSADRARWVLRELLKRPNLSPDALRAVLKAGLEAPLYPSVQEMPRKQMVLPAVFPPREKRKPRPLPQSVQEIADVIGRERALYLVGQLPRHAPPSGNGREQVILYVPKELTPDHRLVQILGRRDAQRLVDAFPGEILKPGTCMDLYRDHRDAGILSAWDDGVPISMIAQWFKVSTRHVQNVVKEQS